MSMAKPTKHSAVPPQPKHNAVPARRQSALQRASAPALLRLHGLPRWIFPLFTGLLLVGGLLASSPVLAALLLGLLLLMLLWLVLLSWPLLTPLARIMRGVVLVGLLMVVINRAQGRM